MSEGYPNPDQRHASPEADVIPITRARSSNAMPSDELVPIPNIPQDNESSIITLRRELSRGRQALKGLESLSAFALSIYFAKHGETAAAAGSFIVGAVILGLADNPDEFHQV